MTQSSASALLSGSEGMAPGDSNSDSKFLFQANFTNASQISFDALSTENLKEHLPAVYRSGRGSDRVSIPSYDLEFLQRELLVRRLDAIQDHLWFVGRPMPPRPLHYQIVLSRTIVISENMDQHLVWTGTRIFLKPIPAYLLETGFWSEHLALQEHMDDGQRRAVDELKKSARGFLFTYVALISYESDFRIAKESHLIPENVTWDQWKEFSRRFLQDFQYSSVNPRFWYGELRLSRLNAIYRWRKGFLWRGYSKIASHISYKDLLRDNFHLLAAILGYVVIVLTAMQVGLATEQLATNVPFQNVSYGISVVSILAPLILGVAILGIVVFIVIYNWIVTKSYEKRRFREMGLLPGFQEKDTEDGRR
ncbi:hypothetical protein AA313_de0207355 [Arthrobotrys entomopaga]|nr:hypothetical protein AA313_de0207355 [Arthrobotrys entomopaga]